MVYQDEFRIETRGHGDMHQLDSRIQGIVDESGIERGIVTVCNIGSTGGLGMIEYEPGLQRDLPEMLDRLIPPSRHYGHEQAWHDGNGHSHLQATLLRQSLTLPVTDGRLRQGTWQQVFHLECDVRPRDRTISVTVIGDV